MTQQEAAEEYSEPYRCPATNENEYCKHDIISAFNNGAKWQKQKQDKFAIEFAQWINSVSYRSFDGNWYLTQIDEDIKKTTEELLEIFKKEKKTMKHKVEVLSKEEVLANRSNAYEFIDFNKEEALEEEEALEQAVSKLSKSISKLEDAVNELSKERIGLSKSIDNLKSKI